MNRHFLVLLSLPSSYLTDVVQTQEVLCRWRVQLSHLKKKHVDKLSPFGHSLQVLVSYSKFSCDRMNLSAVFCLCQMLLTHVAVSGTSTQKYRGQTT